MAGEQQVNDVKVYRDSAGFYQERPDDAAVTALKAQLDATTATIPQPATTTPRTEMTGGSTGASPDKFARADHQHPRLTSTTYATLASDGTATVTFTRPFTNKPGVNMTETEAAGKQPLVCSVQSWSQDANGIYTGCIIKGQRAQMLPTINPLAGTLSLLTAVVSGINGVVSQLTGYNVFGGGAAGATVSIIAVARSDVAPT